MAKRAFINKQTTTPKELKSMRNAAVSTLPDNCTIYTLTENVDTIGAVQQLWTATYENVSCRLLTKFSGTEKMFGAAIASTASHIMKVPFNQTLSNTHRVVHNGITYEVIRVDRDTTDFTATYAALLRTDVDAIVNTPIEALPPAPPPAPDPPPSTGEFDDSFDNTYEFT